MSTLKNNKNLHNGKNFVVWSGDIEDKIIFSKKFKELYNSPDNREGKIIKIVLGTESIMEGVDFKEVKYVHEPTPENNSTD